MKIFQYKFDLFYLKSTIIEMAANFDDAEQQPKSLFSLARNVSVEDKCRNISNLMDQIALSESPMPERSKHVQMIRKHQSLSVSINHPIPFTVVIGWLEIIRLPARVLVVMAGQLTCSPRCLWAAHRQPTSG